MALMTTPEPALGSPAPEFSLPDVRGPLRSLQDCAGPAGLLVMFICNHCPYVQALRDRLLADMRELQALGVGVVAIASNDFQRFPDDGPEALRAQAESWGFEFPYLLDASQDIARAYGAVCTPDFFGYDAALRLRYRGRLDAAHRGPRGPETRRDLVDAMTQVAAGAEVTQPQIASMGCSIKWRSAP